MLSLKLLFNRKGWVVNALLFIGWALHLWQLSRLPDEWVRRGGFTCVIFLLFAILGLTVTLMRCIPWYGREGRGLGIEEHFEKNLVPIAYILPIGFLLMRVFDSPWPYFLFMDFFFLIMLAVNATMLYYHFIDTDRSPPSYFTTHRRTY